MRTALITIAAGRSSHLTAQAAAVARSTLAPEVYVVVAMDDPALVDVVPQADVVHVSRVHGALPLAAARNAGVARARELGAELLVLLDVDCLPEAGMLARYAQVAGERGGVLCGPVGYLPPRPAGGYPASGLRELARPHPARPVPGDNEILSAEQPELFWSLSFAVTAATWDVIGGFCEQFYGYGGEDTDFGHSAVRAGVAMWWVGGAWAYHQDHGPGGPPVQHLDDIVRNVEVFRARWGWEPMGGWLDDFARAGLIVRDPDSDRWVHT